ncbi:hypothetical protein [Streptomyces sp. RPT161]|uniref:hypothetical protein n=1 Tax=Streptomyces sp. RPT161 TaxID=3015993 RepID=UPI0022B92A89|nr:hypothetical protein [Streptomyces sp. RPT161]
MTHPAQYTALPRTVETVTAIDLITSGGVQVIVVCPNCSSHHRHLGLGLRRSPCGTWYVIDRPGDPARVARIQGAA